MPPVIKQNDNRPYVTDLLFEGGDDPDLRYYVDPTGWTVTFNMNRASAGAVVVDQGAAFVVSVAIGAARAAALQAAGYRLANGDDFIAGTYNAVQWRWASGSGTAGAMEYEWQTDNGGAIRTFPNDGNNTLTITAELN